MSVQRGFVPIEDVARHFCVSISTIRAWVRQHRIPHDTYIKVGNTYRFSIPRVEDALLSMGATSVKETNNEEDDAQLELDFGSEATQEDDDEGDVWDLDTLDDLDCLDDELGLFDEDI